jgi:hypothetical protein
MRGIIGKLTEKWSCAFPSKQTANFNGRLNYNNIVV